MEQLKETVNSGFFFFPKIWHDFLIWRSHQVWHWRSLNLNAKTKLHTQNLELVTLSIAKVSQSLDSKLRESGNCIRLRKLKKLKTPTSKSHIDYLLSSITGSFKLTHWSSLRCHYKLLFSSKSHSMVQIWTCNLETLQSSLIATKAPNVISHFGSRSSHYHKPHIEPNHPCLPFIIHLTGPPFDHLNPPSLLPKNYSLNSKS